MGLKGSRVVEARPWDQGSNGRGDGPDRVASLAECRTALADKSVADEWFARDLKPLAIFKFPTAYGYTPMAGEIDVPLPTVLADFPTMPIVSVWKGRFQVFDRTKGLFFPAAYADLPKA
ncbi:hypothetical protein BDI01nite_28890 [Brevundimonas diminuta]|nr:hypothetical protein BDI01nite_28890 [Brevundimonas diminuta]